MDKFEAITCQWNGLQLTIFATRIVSEAEDLVFTKKTMDRPNNLKSTLKTHTINVLLNFEHGATFTRLLTDVLSLSRLVYLNYKKLNSLLQNKQSYSLEQLYFSEDDEDILFKSDSTAPDEFVDNRINNTIDEGLKERILKSISEVAFEPDVLTYNNWGELVLKMTTYKRNSSSTSTSATVTLLTEVD